MAEPSRRFPPPWRADKTPHGYVVRDANGQELAYVYTRATEVEARQAKVLTADEGRRIAANIARAAGAARQKRAFVGPYWPLIVEEPENRRHHRVELARTAAGQDAGQRRSAAACPG